MEGELDDPVEAVPSGLIQKVVPTSVERENKVIDASQANIKHPHFKLHKVYAYKNEKTFPYIVIFYRIIGKYRGDVDRTCTAIFNTRNKSDIWSCVPKTNCGSKDTTLTNNPIRSDQLNSAFELRLSWIPTLFYKATKKNQNSKNRVYTYLLTFILINEDTKEVYCQSGSQYLFHVDRAYISTIYSKEKQAVINEYYPYPFSMKANISEVLLRSGDNYINDINEYMKKVHSAVHHIRYLDDKNKIHFLNRPSYDPKKGGLFDLFLEKVRNVYEKNPFFAFGLNAPKNEVYGTLAQKLFSRSDNELERGIVTYKKGFQNNYVIFNNNTDIFTLNIFPYNDITVLNMLLGAVCIMLCTRHIPLEEHLRLDLPGKSEQEISGIISELRSELEVYNQTNGMVNELAILSERVVLEQLSRSFLKPAEEKSYRCKSFNYDETIENTSKFASFYVRYTPYKPNPERSTPRAYLLPTTTEEGERQKQIRKFTQSFLDKQTHVRNQPGKLDLENNVFCMSDAVIRIFRDLRIRAFSPFFEEILNGNTTSEHFSTVPLRSKKSTYYFEDPKEAISGTEVFYRERILHELNMHYHNMLMNYIGHLSGQDNLFDFFNIEIQRFDQKFKYTELDPGSEQNYFDMLNAFSNKYKVAESNYTKNPGKKSDKVQEGAEKTMEGTVLEPMEEGTVPEIIPIEEEFEGQLLIEDIEFFLSDNSQGT